MHQDFDVVILLNEFLEHYLYDHIIPKGSSSFTNSAFTQSPHRTVTKEFDPYMK